jgi:hypothetical protein
MTGGMTAHCGQIPIGSNIVATNCVTRIGIVVCARSDEGVISQVAANIRGDDFTVDAITRDKILVLSRVRRLRGSHGLRRWWSSRHIGGYIREEREREGGWREKRGQEERGEVEVAGRAKGWWKRRNANGKRGLGEDGGLADLEGAGRRRWGQARTCDQPSDNESR